MKRGLDSVEGLAEPVEFDLKDFALPIVDLMGARKLGEKALRTL
jgi:hypothetical protein